MVSHLHDLLSKSRQAPVLRGDIRAPETWRPVGLRSVPSVAEWEDRCSEGSEDHLTPLK
jgi:hypothetical protein